MKNFLKILAATVLAYIIAILRFVAAITWIWLPFLMDHWSSIIIGVVVAICGEILYYKFLLEITN